MATNHSEESGGWWILGEEFVNPPLMAHFAFEQQLSEAVGGLGYISLPFQNSFLELSCIHAGSYGFLHQCELHNRTPVSQTKYLQAQCIWSWTQQVHLLRF